MLLFQSSFFLELFNKYLATCSFLFSYSRILGRHNVSGDNCENRTLGVFLDNQMDVDCHNIHLGLGNPDKSLGEFSTHQGLEYQDSPRNPRNNGTLQNHPFAQLLDIWR